MNKSTVHTDISVPSDGTVQNVDYCCSFHFPCDAVLAVSLGLQPHGGSGAVMCPDLFVGVPVLYKSFTYLLPYLFSSLRVGPFCFQAIGHKMRSSKTGLLVFCVVVYFDVDSCLL